MPFELRLIPLQNRPLTNPDGSPLRGPDGNQVGAAPADAPGILHWYNGPKGQAWLNEAAHQIAIAVGNGDGPTRARALEASARAVCRVYDCYNIPWSNDPGGRSLYRERIAGAPGPGNETPREFGATAPYDNYNPSVSSRETSVRDFAGGPMWTEYPMARVMDAIPTWGGKLPEAALRAFARQFQNRDPGAPAPRFFESLRFYLEPVPLPPPPEFVGGFVDLSFPAFTDADLMAAPGLRNAVQVNLGSDVSHGNLFCRRAGGTDCTASGSVYDRDAYWFDDGAHLSAAFGDWTTYVADWIVMLRGRSPEQVILDSRAYCVYLNESTVKLIGRAGAWPAMQAKIRELETGVADPSVQIVGAAAVALGSALAGETFGISALIGGAIAGVTSILGATAPPDVARLAVNDLRICKPIFERGWLAGDPSTINVQTGSVSDSGNPERNGLVIPDPPGWTPPTVNPRDALHGGIGNAQHVDVGALHLGRLARRQNAVAEIQATDGASGVGTGVVVAGVAAVGAVAAWKTGLLDSLIK